METPCSPSSLLFSPLGTISGRSHGSFYVRPELGNMCSMCGCEILPSENWVRPENDWPLRGLSLSAGIGPTRVSFSNIWLASFSHPFQDLNMEGLDIFDFVSSKCNSASNM
jgi:hypothetical protein